MNYIRRSWTSTVASLCIAVALASGLAAHAMLSIQPETLPTLVPAVTPETPTDGFSLSKIKDFFLKLGSISDQDEAVLREAEERDRARTINVLSHWVKENSRYGGRLSLEASRKIVLTTIEAANSAGLDPLLILALIKIESNFDPKAVSSAGAIGLTQIIPFWHADKGVTKHTALNPEFSINTGVKILVEYLGWHNGDLRKALLQYNGSLKIKGATYADNVLSMQQKINDFVETKRYEQIKGSAVQTADGDRDQRFKPS